jgi:hypothetical protein
VIHSEIQGDILHKLLVFGSFAIEWFWHVHLLCRILSACILSLTPSVLGAIIVSIVIAGSCSLFLDLILSVSDDFDVSGVFLWGVLHRVSSSRAIVGRCSDGSPTIDR